MSILKQQVSSSSICVSLFIVMTHNSTVTFKHIHFLLRTKRSHQSSNLDTFECSCENIQNSSCHFPSHKSVFLQILHHSSMSWKITSLYFFSSNNIYFVQKSSAQVKICQIPYVNFETTSRFISKFCISLQFLERYLLYNFLAQTIYTLLKRSPLKWKLFRLLSTQVEIWQIIYVSFEMTSRFLSKFCILHQFNERLLLCTFLAQTICTLLKRSPLKGKFLRLLSAQVKICQIPYANFESPFLFKFCILLQFHER